MNEKNSFRHGINNLLNSVFCYFYFDPGYRGLISATLQIVIPTKVFCSQSKLFSIEKPMRVFLCFPLNGRLCNREGIFCSPAQSLGQSDGVLSAPHNES